MSVPPPQPPHQAYNTPGASVGGMGNSLGPPTTSTTAAVALASTALRALPALPHTTHLLDISPVAALDLKRRLEQLDRLKSSLNNAAIGDSAPAPPSASSLLPLPPIPQPPTRPTADPKPTSQTLKSRIIPRPKSSNRYNATNTGTVAGTEQDNEDTLQNVINRFNAIHDGDTSPVPGSNANAEPGPSRSAQGARCRLSLHPDDLILATFVTPTVSKSAQSQADRNKAKRRRTRGTVGSTLHAWIGLSEGIVRHFSLHRTSSPSRIPPIETPPNSGPDAILCTTLSPSHSHPPLTLSEVLDRLPHIPALLSSPCVYCNALLRPPDGLPLQGVGYLAPARSPKTAGTGAVGSKSSGKADEGTWVCWHAACGA